MILMERYHSMQPYKIERNITELNSAVEAQQQCLNQYREFIAPLQTIEGQKKEWFRDIFKKHISR